MIDELIRLDPYLEPYQAKLCSRAAAAKDYRADLIGNSSLEAVSTIHKHLGLHSTEDGWVFREWAPNATSIYLICGATDWQDSADYALARRDGDIWELHLGHDQLSHGDSYKLSVHWSGGSGHRIPAYATRTVQDDHTKDFTAQVWVPEHDYQWQNEHHPVTGAIPLIYEAHIGMSGEEPRVSTYAEFQADVLPRIHAAGYNTVQLMAIQEHPYYGSFGYHVSGFYAASSRYGSPDELKSLIDAAHGLGISVIIDLVHSHAVKNTVEGLGLFDGTDHQYFHAGDRGLHPAWDSRCFDYGKHQVAKFLLSNCRYWLEEYNLDGFRFDGITSMLYTHHGLSRDFTNYQDYFEDIDQEAYSYLSLANDLIHQIKPHAISIAEEVSGMPGLVWPSNKGGAGFDYRLSMGMPDMWIKLIKESHDEDWDLRHILHELMQHRPEERTISYVESHDQALVGDKTVIFRLVDKDMYTNMSVDNLSPLAERGIALHKMIRLLSASTNSGGYLNFMGNEFGHPEWIDFPRVGNDWSYAHARRQWSLADNDDLAYKWLSCFDVDMLASVSELRGPISHHNIHQEDLLMSYMRSGRLFVYNLSPSRSYVDYGIPAHPGHYRLLLSSDSVQYGGYGHVDDSLDYITDDQGNLKIYIPARTCLVFRLQD